MNITKTLIILLFSFSFLNVHGQYYDFPFPGWKQTFTSFTWTGLQFETGISTLSFDRDTLLNNQIYVTNGLSFFRTSNGKIYQNIYDWQSQSFDEVLEYDFSLNVGDSFQNYHYAEDDSVKVIAKNRITNLIGDSIWRMQLEYQLNWIVKDTFVWLEGVGNLNSGLIKTNFPDGGFVHACTLLSDNRKLSVNPNNTEYCNCNYVYGVDQDNDGFGNYIPQLVEIHLGPHFNNPSAKKYYKIRSCDTLRIVSNDLALIYLNPVENCDGPFISIDEFAGEFEFTIYDISTYTKIYLSDQCAWDFAEITVEECFTNDCDDNNSQINPDRTEEPYNGIDDDCNSTTLDDDLDQDGFLINVDCDDTNPDINPDADEITNNGIDEDCNGTDLTTSTFELANSRIDIYPNPVSVELLVNIQGGLKYEIKLFTIHGKLIFKSQNMQSIPVFNIDNGAYILRIQDLNSSKNISTRIIVAK